MDMYENLKKDLDPNRIKVENCSHSFVVERSHGSKTGDYVCPVVEQLCVLQIMRNINLLEFFLHTSEINLWCFL